MFDKVKVRKLSINYSTACMYAVTTGKHFEFHQYCQYLLYKYLKQRLITMIHSKLLS